jgi:hypothetical protein
MSTATIAAPSLEKRSAASRPISARPGNEGRFIFQPHPILPSKSSRSISFAPSQSPLYRNLVAPSCKNEDNAPPLLSERALHKFAFLEEIGCIAKRAWNEGRRRGCVDVSSNIFGGSILFSMPSRPEASGCKSQIGIMQSAPGMRHSIRKLSPPPTTRKPAVRLS